MNTLFYERQRFRHPLLILSLGIISFSQFYIFFRQIIQNIPVGKNPAPDWMAIVFLLVFGIVLPLFLFSITLKTTVYDNGIRVQFFPLTKARWIPVDSITSYSLLKYNALLEYGGWGIRIGRNGKAYNISGNTGLRLTFKDGSHLLIGTKKAQMLENTMGRIAKKNK